MAAPPAAKKGAGGLASLPEEVLLIVFSRLRIKDLFLLAVTSTWWLRLFTDDPAFLRAAQGHGARLLGFFFQQTSFIRCPKMRQDHMMQRASAFAPTFFPTPGSHPLLGPTDRALTYFVSDADGAFNYATPLASRHGIVLMRLVPRSPDMAAFFTPVVFGLCNPVTSERHVTPLLEGVTWPELFLGGYAIVTAADSSLDLDDICSSRRHVFTQLIVTSYDREGLQWLVYSYDAATRRWTTLTACLHRDEHEVPFRLEGANAAVVHRGAAHWLYTDQNLSTCPPTSMYTLRAEVGGAGATPRVSMTKLPLTAGESPFLYANRDGRLSVASLYGMCVEVWTQQQQDGGGGGDHASPWLRTRLIRIPIEVPSAHPYAMVSQREWFEFNGGAMLVLFDGGAVFLLDLEKKKKVEKLMDLPPRLFSNERCKMVVPYEMDLSEFFAFQLGSLFARWNKQHVDLDVGKA
ncbi:hypothetical protein PR202_ga08409 [Eleusine coracana subsp. coracana]|uniref:F-box domain-containing protein n=1 Tax=Eleusine coracana subsp. coracana TaxID=191504 RepID=A0AAV5C0J3_ELECO|nr:hypothetical protein QOZ80_1AG0045480 [Eleusine coracana subsp. coracana]GJM91986.1 hypothetical protein PR202_ga08409 [Eleusine coracana subsp. coracana]